MKYKVVCKYANSSLGTDDSTMMIGSNYDIDKDEDSKEAVYNKIRAEAKRYNDGFIKIVSIERIEDYRSC